MKQAVIDEYTIELDESGKVSVRQLSTNVKETLRAIYVRKNWEFDPKWTTQQFGSDLIKRLGRGNPVTVDEFTVLKRENGSIAAYRNFNQDFLEKILKQISGNIGLKTGLTWNTDKLGAKIIDFINDTKESDSIKRATNKRDKNLNEKQQHTITMKIYQEAYCFSDGLAPVKDNGKWGYIDKTGRLVIKPIFEKAYGFQNALAFVKLNDKWGVIDKTGKFLWDPIFDSLNNCNESTYVVRKGSKYGLIDRYGSLNYFNFNYKDIEKYGSHGIYFCEGLSYVKLKSNHKYGYIDSTGKFVIEPRFDRAYHFKNGMASVSISGKSGIIDKNGIFIIEPRYEYCNINDGTDLFTVGVNKKSGLINISGQFIIEPIYDEIRYLDGIGLFSVMLNGKYGLANAAGKIILEPRLDELGIFFDTGVYEREVIAIKINDKYALLNSKGQIITELFDLMKFGGTDKLFYGHIDGKVGVIDVSGKYKYILQPTYYEDSNILCFDNGLSLIKHDNKYGYINIIGECVINPVFEDAKRFSEDTAWVKLDGKWGLIDKQGEYVINPVFEDTEPFKNSVACVKLNGKWGLIDKLGNYIIKPKYLKLEVRNCENDNIFLVKIDEIDETKYTFINNGQFM